MDILSFKTQFDAYTEEWLEKKMADYRALVIDTSVLSYITHSAALIRGGGKRLRPYLTALMHGACGGEKQGDILRAGLALELFHTFALIHDDIIDHGVLRRDIPTTHVTVLDILKKGNRTGDIAHVANGQAMLVGDLVYLWVFEVFQGISFPEPKKSQAFSYLVRMVNEVIVGEMMDVDMTTRGEVEDALLYQKTLLKTATYTFVRPMQIGAILGGAGEEVLSFCERFGKALGMAFQIQDDLFDVTLSAEELHKTILSDVAEGQHTYFTQYIFTQGTEREKEKLLLYFGKPFTEKQHGDIVGLFESSGAVAYGKILMNQYFDEASAALETAQIPPTYRDTLGELISYIRLRTS